ncbi:MAG: hypothetical protein E7661_01395 [Ruminococcaceae bacterium]|nr:hypothetical protein [Oscillospiraceae bacterium]
MKKLQATEYMYASARIRAMENRLVGRERIDVLVEARSSEDVMNKLAEYGISPTEEEGSARVLGEAVSRKREEMLLSLLKTAYDEVSASVPEPAVYAWFRYPYDCNNIKAVIKCQIRGIDPSELLFDFGAVSAKATVEALTTDKYGVFPSAMAKAAAEAREAYAKSGDPQQIDAILDKACYEDMLAAVTASGCETMIGWVKAKVDLVNIMIALRIIRMNRGEMGKIFMNTSLLPGGSVPHSFFEEVYDGGEEALWSGLAMGKYSRFVSAAEGTNNSLASIEKCADDHWTSLVREGAKVSFGAEVAGGYLVGVEVSVKNIRIILAAKDAGLSSDVLRERIRESYV